MRATRPRFFRLSPSMSQQLFGPLVLIYCGKVPAVESCKSAAGRDCTRLKVPRWNPAGAVSNALKEWLPFP